MKKTSLFAIAFGFACLWAADARAEVKVHKAGQVSVDVPTGWSLQAPDENTMIVMDPKQDVLVRLAIVDAADTEKAVNVTEAQVRQFVQDVKWSDKHTPIKLNGMNGIRLEGSGAIKGKPVDLGVLLVESPSKKVVLVLVLIDHATVAAHKAEVSAFLNSLKPAK